jgi:hypothetical protein
MDPRFTSGFVYQVLILDLYLHVDSRFQSELKIWNCILHLDLSRHGSEFQIWVWFGICIVDLNVDAGSGFGSWIWMLHSGYGIWIYICIADLDSWTGFGSAFLIWDLRSESGFSLPDLDLDSWFKLWILDSRSGFLVPELNSGTAYGFWIGSGF